MYLTDSLFTTGDTIIDMMNYKIIFREAFESFLNYGKYYIREDTNSGKYYIRRSIDLLNEYLFMDLSLNVGDTFIIHNNPFFFDSIAVADSVFYIANLKVIKTDYQIYTLGSENNLIFHESIGPNNGLCYLFQGGGDFYWTYYYTLLCQFKDDTLYYHNTSAFESGPCYFFGGGYIEENDFFIKNIYPNPFTNNLIFEFKKPFTDVTLRIYNSMGALAAIKNAQNCDRIEVNTTSFSSGIYFYSVVYNDWVIGRGKIIKD